MLASARKKCAASIRFGAVLHDQRDFDPRLALLLNARKEIERVKIATHNRRRGPTTGFRTVDVVHAASSDSSNPHPNAR